MAINTKRIMGIDYGDVRTGIALSDTLWMMANGIGTYKAENDGQLLETVLKIAKENSVSHFVLGHPINMNGTLGERSERVRAFASLLESESGLPVILIDERMTTMEAHRYLNASDTRGKKRKAVVDTLSAQIILQTFLDSPACKALQKQ